MPSTEDRPGFAVRSIRFEVVMEVLMLIRVRRHDKISHMTQRVDVRVVRSEPNKAVEHYAAKRGEVHRRRWA
jgi:hypothetical protein